MKSFIFRVLKFTQGLMNFTAKKILIIRLSSLGDIILTTPVIRALKKQYPEIKIDFLLRKSYADVLKYNPELNELFLFENYSGVNTLINIFKDNDYDFAVDLQNNFRSREIMSNLNIPKFVYHKPNIKKFLLVNFKINFLKDYKTIPTRYAEAITGLTLDEKGLELFIPNNITPKLERESIIGFCPGSRHYTKMWLEEYFIELGNKFAADGYQIVLFGGKSDIDICSRISGKIRGAQNFANNNKLLQTAADMKACRLLICNDSGMMHTATAVGVPVAALFGSTVKEFGFAPYKSSNLILENNSLSCRPCSHIGREKCPKEHFECMRLLTPDYVYKQIQKFMLTL